MQSWNRRKLLKFVGSSACAGILPWHKIQAATNEPHFFLQVLATDGWDVSYMFDARPLALTAAGKITNYLDEEPTPWTGNNGQVTLATRLTDVLKPYRDYFSVLNGVLMAPSFDGHDQNTNQLLTGNPFGGDSFIPHLNLNSAPLDFVKTGYVYASITNEGAGVPLDSYSASILSQKVRESEGFDTSSPIYKFIKSRAHAVSTGTGRLSAAAAKIKAGYEKAPNLNQLLRDINMDSNDESSEVEKNLDMISEFFRSGATTNAVMTLRPENSFLDTHSADDARQSGAILGEITDQIATIFKFLSETPYDATRSLLDVTTVMVTSEFSRTMRQPGLAIDECGTDHNPLNNTVLIGGKGIRCGLVLGESDFRTADENLSEVHTSFDAGALKMMGRPFDFTTNKVKTSEANSYKESDYLTINNVANSVYQLFGAPSELWRTIGRNGPQCSVISQMMV